MTMKRVARCVLLASALLMVPLMIPFTTDAQQLPGGRDTSLEMLEQGFDLLGVDLPNALSDYWNTPEGKARYEQLVLERFDEKVEEFSELGKEDWATQYDAVSDRRARREFENRVEDLEKITGDIIEFFEWRYAAEPIEVDAPSAESVRDGMVEITPMVEQILEAISTLAGPGIQVQEFVEMRENLAEIHVLSRVMRD